jgi:hypothetical protein
MDDPLKKTYEEIKIHRQGRREPFESDEGRLFRMNPCASLKEKCPDGLDKLRSIFGITEVDTILPRLDEIHEACESAWENYLGLLHGREVRYLLIAEAAPWTESGSEPSYFYKNLCGSWCKRILNAFDIDDRIGAELCLRRLAEEGFLLVDTMPFATKFSTNIRKGEKYSNLLNSCRGFFEGKLFDCRISWSPKLKVALAFKWHARKLFKNYPNGLSIPSLQPIMLSESMIAADRSGYTNPNLLNEIWNRYPTR